MVAVFREAPVFKMSSDEKVDCFIYEVVSQAVPDSVQLPVQFLDPSILLG